MNRKALFLAAAFLAACAQPADQTAAKSPAHRIVSLVPSLTEDLCAVGAAKQLVGVSKFTADIPCARGLPQVNDATSIDAERIVALHPDLVVGIPSERLMTAPLARAHIPVVFVTDESYNDIFTDMTQLGKLSGHAAQADAAERSLQQRTAALSRTASAPGKRRPSVFVVLQTNPIWTVGPQSYVSALINIAGGRNAVTSLRSAYGEYSAEALLRLQPDALVASSDSGLGLTLSREPWRSLKAVRNGHVFLITNAALLYRPGPRYNEGVAWLSARLAGMR